MNQEDTINKIILEMHRRRMYDQKQESWVKGYLEMAYGAGFDEGRMQRSHRKKVCKIDKYGKILETYESVTVAARIHRVNTPNIYDAIAGKQSRSAGYFWRYATK